jgi:hypothetical protein
MTKKQRMHERIEQHGRSLLRLFPNAKEQDPVKLCKRLRRMESLGRRKATDYCNGVIDGEQWSAHASALRAKVSALLDAAELHYAIMINGDPRGYCLKVHSGIIRDWNNNERKDPDGLPLYTDWGGYGILAPDLTND